MYSKDQHALVRRNLCRSLGRQKMYSKPEHNLPELEQHKYYSEVLSRVLPSLPFVREM
ncbi:hypothetical protein VIBNISFn118_140064 [Vibrio nigripulchritudo SFn118]|nr:hypothetical protein VIBNISFn118_140064 [Vibrio nigripulchritudo SFn118]